MLAILGLLNSLSSEAAAATWTDFNDVTLSADGAYAFAAGRVDDHTSSPEIRVWSTATGEQLPSLVCEAGSKGVEHLLPAPGLAVVAVTYGDSCVFTALDQPPQKLEGRAFPSADGRTLVVYRGSAHDRPDNVIRVLSLPDLAEQKSTIVPWENFPNGVKISIAAEAHLAAFVRGSTEIAIVDALTGAPVSAYAGKESISDFAISPDGKLLVVSGYKGTKYATVMVDVATGKRLWDRPFPSLGPTFTPDSDQLNVVQDRQITVYGHPGDQGAWLRQEPSGWANAYEFDTQYASGAGGSTVTTRLDIFWRAAQWSSDGRAAIVAHNRADAAGPLFGALYATGDGVLHVDMSKSRLLELAAP